MAFILFGEFDSYNMPKAYVRVSGNYFIFHCFILFHISLFEIATLLLINLWVHAKMVYIVYTA